MVVQQINHPHTLSLLSYHYSFDLCETNPHSLQVQPSILTISTFINHSEFPKMPSCKSPSPFSPNLALTPSCHCRLSTPTQTRLPTASPRQLAFAPTQQMFQQKMHLPQPPSMRAGQVPLPSFWPNRAPLHGDVPRRRGAGAARGERRA